MAGFIIDLFVCAATSGVCVGVWLLTVGSTDKLTKIAQDPTLWQTYDFWPVWVILACATALVIHLGIVLALGLFGGRARRRRRELAREAHKAARDLHRQAHAAKAARQADRRAERRGAPRRGPAPGAGGGGFRGGPRGRGRERGTGVVSHNAHTP